MKRFLLMTGAASIIALTACVDIKVGSTAYAARDANTVIGGEVSATLNESGDFRMTGADVSVSGRVGGELQVTAADFTARGFEAGALNLRAADIRYAGQVNRDVSLTGADIVWQGDIGGDAHIRGADLRFNGAVDGALEAHLADADLSGRFSDIELNAADLKVREDATIYGDVHVNAAKFDFDGDLHGHLSLSARTVYLNGAVREPFEIQADPGQGRLSPRDGLVEISGQVVGGEICARRVVITGEVTGALTVMADEAPELRQNAQASQINYTPRNGQRCERA